MNAPELWTLEGIGQWLGVSEDTARRLAGREGFPEPIIPGGGGKNTKKRWFATEVVDFVRQNRALPQ